MESTNKKNKYTCPNGHHIITQNLHEGVTPMFIQCATDKCGQNAKSSFYMIDQSLMATHEWFKPTEEELNAEVKHFADKHKMNFNELLVDFRDHVNKGGLLLRKRFMCGIVCDNYKVAKFEEEIKSRGLEYDLAPGVTANTTNVRVICDVATGAEIATKIEGGFQSSKAKNN